jgi:beta-glucanase (GH16 family)
MKKILQITLALSVATLLGCGGDDGGDDGTTGGGTGSIAIPTTGFTSPSSYDGMTLVWEDQFEGTTLDIANWTHETGTGSNGWGNNELQYYRSNNTTLQDGHLIITAKEESVSGSNYTSSRIISKDKKTFRYGRIDVRAALPRGKGLWPAIWMLGNNFETVGWPACGEIDIMEMVGGGSGDRTVHGTVHWENSGQHAEYGGNTSLSSGTFNDEFHVFSIEWTASEIRWYLDDTEFHVISTTPAELDEFRRSFFFIMNVAVGGNWPGNPDATTTFPQHMIVDYVRVFQAD